MKKIKIQATEGWESIIRNIMETEKMTEYFAPAEGGVFVFLIDVPPQMRREIKEAVVDVLAMWFGVHQAQHYNFI